MSEKTIKKLPLGLSAFSELIQENYVYVDKTQDIYRMAHEGKYYFLSRPRRFGKSLLVSTLDALFSGKKDLFKNLWISTSDWEWVTHPVIRLDFSAISNRTVSDLIANISVCLDDLAKPYNLDISGYPTIDSKFKALIQGLAQKNRVVILIDEYDKPILDHIENPEKAKEQRAVLKALYSVIKSSDQYLRFVLLTGVSKFAKTSIFSGINNLEDISLDRRYATLLGYTAEEVTHYFSSRIQQFAHELGERPAYIVNQLRETYDGYQFTKKKAQVFNPYSVLTSLDKHDFDNYWFETGTPTFLIKLLQKRPYRPDAVFAPELNEKNLGSFEPDNIPLSALLFQTGYLTIKEYNPKNNNYLLGVPNREVNSGLTINLVDAFTQLPPDESIYYAKLLSDAFIREDMQELYEKLQEFFNRMPYTVHITDEYRLQFVMYAIFALIGVSVDPEVVTSRGRADLIVDFPQLIYVIELKFNKSAREALEQIKDRAYYEKYENLGKKITLVGINFNAQEKTVSLESQALE